MTPDDVKQIVEQNKVAIFMKGNKMFPRCGFSARALYCIQQCDVPFEAVDVLSDPTIRPALVEYSKWPTTPQVFIDGKLIGGSDIVVEMFEKGEFQSLVKAAVGAGAEG